MATPALTTILKMIESLPETRQNQIVEHLREYIADLEDEDKWDKAFARTQEKLAYKTRQVERQIAEDKSEPMDFDRL
jgi:hypothetical protein